MVEPTARVDPNEEFSDCDACGKPTRIDDQLEATVPDRLGRDCTGLVCLGCARDAPEIQRLLKDTGPTGEALRDALTLKRIRAMVAWRATRHRGQRRL